MGPRNRVGIGLAYRPAKLHRPAESIPVPEIIDPIFAKTSSKRSFSLIENERFGLVVVKTGSINSGTGLLKSLKIPFLAGRYDNPIPTRFLAPKDCSKIQTLWYRQQKAI